MKPKILLVVTRAEIGGAQISVLRLAQALAQNGQQISVGCGEEGFLTQELQKLHIPVIKFKHLRRTFNPLENWLFAQEIKTLLKRHRFSIIHFNSSNALFGAWGAKRANPNIKTIFTFHGLSLLDPGHQTSFWLKRFYFVLYKQLSQFVDTSVFVCQTNLQLAKKLGLINDGIVIYNGQDPSPLNFYSRPQARQKLSFLFEQSPPQAFWLVSIGRLAYPKNFEFIINQFPFLLQKNPFLRWVIIGEGPERKKYQRLINQLRLNNKIFLLGARPDAHRLLKAFDLFVLPSHYEGLSITLLEALFADLPILASRVGGNAEVVGGEEAELYAPNSSQDFQSKLLALIQSLKLRQQIIAKHQHLKPRFLFQNTFSKYLSIYLA